MPTYRDELNVIVLMLILLAPLGTDFGGGFGANTHNSSPIRPAEAVLLGGQTRPSNWILVNWLGRRCERIGFDLFTLALYLLLHSSLRMYNRRSIYLSLYLAIERHCLRS